MSECVKSGDITIEYGIYKYVNLDGTAQYDWSMTNGDESDELFETVEEAERDVRSRF